MLFRSLWMTKKGLSSSRIADALDKEFWVQYDLDYGPQIIFVSSLRWKQVFSLVAAHADGRIPVAVTHSAGTTHRHMCCVCRPDWHGWLCAPPHGCGRAVPPEWSRQSHYGQCGHIDGPDEEFCGCCRAIRKLTDPCQLCIDLHSLKAVCTNFRDFLHTYDGLANN